MEGSGFAQNIKILQIWPNKSIRIRNTALKYVQKAAFSIVILAQKNSLCPWATIEELSLQIDQGEVISENISLTVLIISNFIKIY